MESRKSDTNNKINRKIAKIRVNRKLCIGAAACIAVAPKTFDLDDENIAVVTDISAHTDEELLQAAQVCPTAAIYLYDKNDNLIYPALSEFEKQTK